MGKKFNITRNGVSIAVLSAPEPDAFEPWRCSAQTRLVPMMKLSDVLRKALDFHRTQGGLPWKVTLNPADLASLVNDEDFARMMEYSRVDDKLQPGAVCRRSGLEWFEDAAVPIGEIRITAT